MIHLHEAVLHVQAESALPAGTSDMTYANTSNLAQHQQYCTVLQSAVLHQQVQRYSSSTNPSTPLQALAHYIVIAYLVFHHFPTPTSRVQYQSLHYNQMPPFAHPGNITTTWLKKEQQKAPPKCCSQFSPKCYLAACTFSWECPIWQGSSLWP
jgi:hypothetical protein